MRVLVVLGTLFIAACASAPRVRMGEVVLRPRDRMEIHGEDLQVTLRNSGPGALQLTALGDRGAMLRTPWTLGTGEILVAEPGLRALQVDNLSEETTQVAVEAQGAALRITYRAGTRPEKR